MSDYAVKPITAHTFQDSCWVCSSPFSSSCKEERDHIIPRAYGGIDGPQVSLCDSHHSALHEIALKLYSKKSYFNLLPHKADQDARLLYLASVAYNARVLTEKDPNKKQMVVLHLSGPEIAMLKKLKPVYKNAGRERLIGVAIDLLYKRHFTR